MRTILQHYSDGNYTAQVNIMFISRMYMYLYLNKIYIYSFIAKRLNSILVNLRYLRFKLLKYNENNKNICNTFDHNFNNIPLYIMRKVSLERYYFVLYDCALQKLQKWRLSRFAIKLFIYIYTQTRRKIQSVPLVCQ